MARRKTLPESVRAKQALAERLAALRTELFGERGGPEMARRLEIPVRTWYNYEGGVTVPAEVVLKIIELTGVEPTWLLHGKGAKYRKGAPGRHEAGPPSSMTVGALLRTALRLLENEGPPAAGEAPVSRSHVGNGQGPGAGAGAGAGTLHAHPGAEADLEERADWDESGDRLFVRIKGDAMAPVLSDGAAVAFSERADDPSQLHKKLVVVWVGDEPMVRWFEHCGRYALLRAENPDTLPSEMLVDLEDPREPPRIRRVLWSNSSH